MTDEYEPETQWARRIVSIEQEIDEILNALHQAQAQREDAMRSRCPRRPDSAGARCTADAGHDGDCRYRPEQDMPEPFELAPMTWWDDDRWDVR